MWPEVALEAGSPAQRSQGNELKTNTLFFGRSLMNLFMFLLKRIVRVERKVLSSSQFVEGWMKGTRMVRVNGPVLNIHLWLERRKKMTNRKGKTSTSKVRVPVVFIEILHGQPSNISSLLRVTYCWSHCFGVFLSNYVCLVYTQNPHTRTQTHTRYFYFLYCP